VIYKWSHSRRIIADCLSSAYLGLIRSGYPLAPDRIERDVRRLFADNFRGWVAPR